LTVVYLPLMVSNPGIAEVEDGKERVTGLKEIP